MADDIRRTVGLKAPYDRRGCVAAMGLVVLAMCAARPAGAIECYAAGNAAMDAGRWADAARAFEVAAELPACAVSGRCISHSSS